MVESANRMAGWLSSVGPHSPRSNISNNNNGSRRIYSMSGPNGFEVFIPSGTDRPSRSSCPNPGPQGDNFGHYRPLLGGRIVLGPEWKLFVLHWIGFFIVLVLLLLQHKDIDVKLGRWVLILGLVLHLTSHILFTSISFTDPGVIPLNYTMSELITDTDDYRQRNPGQRFYRYCSKCDGFRPPRCFHCNNCNICIRSQELHMIAGGICVGERTARSFLLMTLLMGALSWYLVVINSLMIVEVRKESVVRRETINIQKLVLATLSLISGIVLLFLPQLGVLMFLFRVYYIGNGSTTRTFINAGRPDEMECPPDQRNMCQNYKHFFFGKKRASAFRKKFNQVHPEFGGLEEDPWFSPTFLQSRDSREMIQITARANEDNIINYARLMNPARHPLIETEETLLLRAFAADARLQSYPSVPHLENGGLDQIPGSRVKTPFKSKPSQILQLHIDQFQKTRQIPKSVIFHRRHNEARPTLSEGCLARGKSDGGQELVQIARAEQFRRIIDLVLLRDRDGLLRMSRRINVAGLLGLENFDPDNLQFVELNNGLPMLAPRRRDVGGPQNVHRFGGLMGIPQMVAAGLLPTAREMVTDVQSRLGPGRVVRVCNTQPVRENNVHLARSGRHNYSQIQAHMTIAPNDTPLLYDTNRSERVNRIVLAQRNLQRAATERDRLTHSGSRCWRGPIFQPMDTNNNPNNFDVNTSSSRGAANATSSTIPSPPVAPTYYATARVGASPNRHRISGGMGCGVRSDHPYQIDDMTELDSRVRSCRRPLRGPSSQLPPSTPNSEDDQQLLVILNDGNVFRHLRDRENENE